METPDQTHSENKTETFVSATQVAALTPMERRVEDERQEFDVRHLMRLQREGKPFRKHLNEDEKDLVGVKQIAPRVEFSPRGRLMFHYLDEMRLQAKAGIAAALEEAPIVEALEREDLFYWWGAREHDLVRMVRAWGEHARACKAKGEPIPTPAYWLLMNQPPRRFGEAKAILEGTQKILVTFIVGAEEGLDIYLTDWGTATLRGRRLS